MPSAVGTSVAFEHKHFLRLIADYLPDPLNDEIYSDFREYLRRDKLID
jgi:hypothetical protein